ncbi:MAG: tetratricopeptide repeat protein [Bacteroidales bacterium]
MKRYLTYFPEYFFLLFFTATCYTITLFYPFHFDDIIQIVQNQAIKSFDRYWDINYWVNIHFRPFSFFTFSINYFLGGLNTLGYHLFNIFVHLTASVFVYHISRELLKAVKFQKEAIGYISILVAVLFVIHPLQTQAVTYIVQRMASMSGMFFFAGFFFYLRARMYYKFSQYQWLVLIIVSMVCFAFAVLSKQNTVVFILLITATEFLLFTPKSLYNNTIIKYITGGLSLIFVIVLSYLYFINGFETVVASIEYKTYFLTQLKMFPRYFLLTLFPVGLSLDYLHVYSESLGFLEIIGGLFIVGLIATGIFLYKKHTVITFGIVWIFIAMLVESFLIPMRDVFVEHRFYLASPGILLIVVYSINLLLQRFSVQTRFAFWVFPVFVLMIATHNRNMIWSCDKKLWLNVIEKYPENYRAHINYGYAVLQDSLPDSAMVHFKKSLFLQNNMYITLNNMGLAYLMKKDTATAMLHFKKSLSLKPDYSYALNNIALLYASTYQIDTALKLIDISLKNPYFNRDDILYTKGRVYLINKQDDKALKYFEDALRINPENTQVYYELFQYWREKDAEKQEYYALQIFKKAYFEQHIYKLIADYFYSKEDFDTAKKMYKYLRKKSVYTDYADSQITKIKNLTKNQAKTPFFLE